MGNVYIWCNQYDEILNTLSGLKEYDSMFRNKIKMNENNFYGNREKNDLLINDIESIKTYLIGVKEFKDVSWIEKLGILAEFIKVNKRRPLEKAEDEKEKRLGIWLSSQIQNRRKCSANMTDKKIRDIWDEFKQNHMKYVFTNEELWYKKLEEVKLFIEKNKKRPSRTKDADTDEKVLGKWISKQMQNQEKRVDIMKDEKIRLVWNDFKQNHMKYIFTYEELWYKKLEEVKLFIEKNKKRPSQTKHTDADEKVLGKWISTQMQNQEKRVDNMKDEKIRLVWDDFKQNYMK